jgi:ATP-dependent Clp protease ATP-binding subunit ClpB
MNIEKFTAASKSLISSTQMIAAKNNHQQITPLHFLSTLLQDENNIIINLINSINADITNIISECRDALNRIVRVEVSNGGGQITMSSGSLKILDRALSLAKSNKDSFVTLERIFEALTYDNTSAGKILSAAHITPNKISAAIATMRKGNSEVAQFV